MFEGPEDYHHRIDDPTLKIDEHSILFIRGTGPIGYPGGAEVVNMQPPAALIKKGVHALPCVGDGRQSGTSGSPSILNASPEAAAGGGLALIKTGDRVRIDLKKRTANILISDEELNERRAALAANGGYAYPEEPDALAADPARDGGAVRRGHGAEARGPLSAPGADDGRAARQSLTGLTGRTGGGVARTSRGLSIARTQEEIDALRGHETMTSATTTQPIGPPCELQPAKRPERVTLEGRWITLRRSTPQGIPPSSTQARRRGPGQR